ncbi:MAG: hypothetical protein R6W90_14965 [Ignavibacteriaceae bacterium]
MNSNSLSIYLLSIFVILLLLRITGLLEFSIIELSGYVLIFYGAAAVFKSLGREKQVSLFSGTIIFFAGLLLFLSANFDFPSVSSLILPAFLFIIGAGFFMLFIDEPSNAVLFIAAAAFILMGIAFTILMGTLEIGSFLKSVWIVTKQYWIVLVIVLIAALLLQKRE